MKLFKTFLPLFLVIIIDTMGIGIVFPVLTPLVMSTKSSLLPIGTSVATREFLYGLVIGVFSLFMLLGAPFCGDLSDRYGRKKVILLCLLATSLSFVLCAFGVLWQSLLILLIGRAVDGFTAGNGSIAQAAIIDISTPENKAKNIALITLASCLGFVVGPVMGGYFAEHPFLMSKGYATPFWVAAIIALLNSLLLWLAFRETHVVKKVTKLSLMRGVHIFIDAFKQKELRRLSAVLILVQMGWSTYFQFISLILIQHYHYTTTHVGYFMAYIGFIFSVSLAVLIPIALRFFSLRQLLLGSLVLASLSQIALIYFNGVIYQWILALPLALGIAFSYSTIITFYSNAVSPEHQGWVMGVAAAVAAAAWLLGALLTGMLGSWSIHAPFILAAAAITGSLFCGIYATKDQAA